MADVPLVKSPVPLADLAGADVATDGQVPMSDGAGGVAWENQSGASGSTVLVESATLTDDTPSVINTFEQWGTEEVTFASAGLPGGALDISASVTGVAEIAAGVTVSDVMKLGISVDGGSTFDYGSNCMVRNDDAHSAAGTTRLPIATQHHVSATPTGDVVVRAEIRFDSTGESSTWKAGRIVAQVVG